MQGSGLGLVALGLPRRHPVNPVLIATGWNRLHTLYNRLDSADTLYNRADTWADTLYNRLDSTDTLTHWLTHGLTLCTTGWTRLDTTGQSAGLDWTPLDSRLESVVHIGQPAGISCTHCTTGWNQLHTLYNRLESVAHIVQPAGLDRTPLDSRLDSTGHHWTVGWTRLDTTGQPAGLDWTPLDNRLDSTGHHWTTGWNRLHTLDNRLESVAHIGQSAGISCTHWTIGWNQLHTLDNRLDSTGHIVQPAGLG
jgi:hypothetical protein